MSPTCILQQSKNHSDTTPQQCTHRRVHKHYFKGIMHLQGHFHGLNVRNEILHFNLVRTLKNEYEDKY